MKLHARTSRRRFLERTIGAAGALALSGCDALSRTEWFPSVLGAGERLSQAAHHLLTPRRAMPKVTWDELYSHRVTIEQAWVVGGTGSIATSPAADVRHSINAL